MVAGKMKAAMGFQKSPATPKTDLPRCSTSSSSNSSSNSKNSKSKSNTVFSRSFGVYFPKSSSQVQPRPPDVSELLKIINELQEKESRLRIELLEHKLLKETVAIVPFLEKEIDIKNAELDKLKNVVDSLEQESKLKDERIKNLESEIEVLRKSSSNDECSSKNKSISKPKEAFKIPIPPPLPAFSSCSSSPSYSSSSLSEANSPPMPLPPPPPAKSKAPPPPPPLPPIKGLKRTGTCVRRVPEVVEFYHSLMRRDSKRESGGGVTDLTSAANARNMIGEIENRSAHLLAIKTEVETQGDLIHSLIKEVNNAAFTKIEDLVTFVKWLDDQLASLVDERAVLKHFDWPELKADAMREAAFGYCDLKKLESEAFNLRDDRRQPCTSALKKMQSLLEKLEHGVYNLSRIREGAVKKYRGLQIPWEWMMDHGFVCQIKLASVKLAMKYMKRVSSELESIAGGPEEEELMLQGVKFAFRVHQFAGGFDIETMRAFEELRDKACSLQNKKQKVLSRSSSLSC